MENIPYLSSCYPEQVPASVFWSVGSSGRDKGGEFARLLEGEKVPWANKLGHGRRESAVSSGTVDTGSLLPSGCCLYT